MDPVAFVLAALPPPPARVLEVGCGAGELALALDVAGYDVVAVDPKAPDNPIFRRTTLAELDDPGPFDVAIARYSLHHIDDLDGAVDRIATLLRPGGKLVLEEFGCDRVDEATASWIAEQQGSSAEAVLADWRDEHAGHSVTHPVCRSPYLMTFENHLAKLFGNLQAAISTPSRNDYSCA